MRIAVIGAGLAGLTSAYELHKAAPDAQVVVFEAADRIGGKLLSVPFNDGPTDMGAEAFLARRSDAVEFFTELGLAGSVVEPSGLRSLVYSGAQLQALPTSGVMGIPSSSQPVAHLVSAESCARIDAESHTTPLAWAIGGDMSVGRVVRERYGDEVVDRVVSALLGGVYSCAADDLGIRATVPQLAVALDDLSRAGEPVTLSAAVARVEDEMSAKKAQAAGAQPRPVFAAFRGGYAELYEALAARSGAEIHLDSFISRLEREGQKFRVTGGGEAGNESFDRVIVATPAPTTARLLAGVAPAAAQALRPVKLASSVVVGFKFDSDTDPDGNALPENSGILVAADEPGISAKAFTLSSRKWPHLAQRLSCGALVRASFGRFGADEIVRADEDDLVDFALDDLQAMTGFDGRAAGLSEIYTQRWFGGIPRYDATHLSTVDATRRELEGVSGLDVTGAWAGGVGVPAVIADARAAAARLLA